MKFIPFQEANKEENVIVVDAYLPGKLNLSHWRGVELPFFLQADTSTEIVLNAIQSDLVDLKNYTCCTNNHFDIDGFLGVWALQNPELAINNATLLAQMARIGDFRELHVDSPIFDRALSLVCYLNQQEKELFYPPFGMNNQEDIACIPKYEYFLNEFAGYIQNKELIESEEYLQVRSQLTEMEVYGKQTFYPTIGLVVVEAPYPMHYYPLFAKSDQVDMVLTIYPDNQYELESKYTTWVQTIRKSFPRILLDNLAKELNQVETSRNKWKGDHFTDTGPILRIESGSLSKEERFDHPMNRTIYSSSIDKEEMIILVTDYLKRKYQNITPQINWSWEQLRAFNS